MIKFWAVPYPLIGELATAAYPVHNVRVNPL